MTEVTESNFTAEVLESETPVVVEFTAPERCAPCRAMAPVFKALAGEHDDVKFVTVNPDENTKLATDYNIMSVPTFMRFDNGQATKMKVGSAPKASLVRELAL